MCPTLLGRLQTRILILIVPAIIGLIISLITGNWDWIALIGLYLNMGAALDLTVYRIIAWQPGWLTGLLGLAFLNQQKGQRPTARVFGLASFSFLVLALLGISWDVLGRIGTAELLVPALWFLVLPAARGVVQLLRWLATLQVLPVLRWGVIGAGLLVLVLFNSDHLAVFYERAAGSYNVMLAREGTTPARLRNLKDAIPTSRKITKTDLAKYLNAWEGHHEVGTGENTAHRRGPEVRDSNRHEHED